MYYYFLATALPAMQMESPPELSFKEFENLLKDNLLPEDFAKVRAIRRFYDLQNVRSLWKGEGLDPWGNLDEAELDEALLTTIGFMQFSYLFDFMEKYEPAEERVRHFPSLVADFFRDEINRAGGFLKQYFEFEREWRLVFTGFRAKKLGRDVAEELQYENPEDPIVAQILAQKDASTYEPPEKYRELKPLFEEYADRPFDLYQALCHFRFNKIEELVGIDMFSIDRVLAYTVQFIIVEKWLEMDKKKGLDIVETIVS